MRPSPSDRSGATGLALLAGIAWLETIAAQRAHFSSRSGGTPHAADRRSHKRDLIVIVESSAVRLDSELEEIGMQADDPTEGRVQVI
jgi:hypothetical protein